MKRLTATVVVLVLLMDGILYALDSKGAAYFGGTLSTFSGSKDPVEGLLDTSKSGGLWFRPQPPKHFEERRSTYSTRRLSILSTGKRPADA